MGAGLGAGVGAGVGAVLSPISLLLGLLVPILKGWSALASTPHGSQLSFRHFSSDSFSFVLLAAPLLSASLVVSPHSMFVTDGPCMHLHPLNLSPSGCSLEGLGST